MRDMKTIVHSKGILHVETPLGIVNIHVGLTDDKGRAVEAISIQPNDRFAGERKVVRRGDRMIQLKKIVRPK